MSEMGELKKTLFVKQQYLVINDDKMHNSMIKIRNSCVSGDIFCVTSSNKRHPNWTKRAVFLGNYFNKPVKRQRLC